MSNTASQNQKSSKELLEVIARYYSPEMIRDGDRARNWTFRFGVLAFIASLVISIATIFNSFNQSSIMQDQTKILKMQTLAQIIETSRSLSAAVSEIDQAIQQLEAVLGTLNERIDRTELYIVGNMERKIRLHIFLPDHCGTTTESLTCSAKKISDIIRKTSLSSNASEDVQLTLIFQALARHFDEISKNIITSSSDSEINKNAFGVIRNAQNVCRDPITITQNVLQNRFPDIPIEEGRRTSNTARQYSLVQVSAQIQALAPLVNQFDQEFREGWKDPSKTQVFATAPTRGNVYSQLLKIISALEEFSGRSQRTADELEQTLNLETMHNVLNAALMQMREKIPPMIEACKKAAEVGRKRVESLAQAPANLEDFIKSAAK